jgi:glycerophosphoryl diester phosphodiesterase
MVTAAHRGAGELAPENTLDAFRYAIAYGVDLIEVDVQQTLDGRFVAFHDTELDAKTDGTGRIGLKTYDEVRALNAADNDRWRGTVYDPARIPSLEEVLALAQRTGVGIYVDMKESVTDVAGLLRAFRAYPGVTERSPFLPYEPARAALITAIDPSVQLMWSNLDERFPAASLFALGERYTWFGSDLDQYDAGKVAAIHDACGLVIPNVYDGAKADVEARQLLAARAMGADGAQINLPDVTADALDEPVATVIRRRARSACLLDARHRVGLPGKPLRAGRTVRTTDRHGCVPAPRSRRVSFAGDGSALASSTSRR